ncbi:lysine--tRNA ligase [Candidatus Dojkabacteria bacterium]|uniref:Lysine--tRNA ligase n=1 Tax=Candidatus Dojkabacteria bacterium TaxID=2099670 RepID=A0A955L764_9BACT|nr:lysine--tRNA ligase [Candidatus Dojkabacteria bacterium]
MSSKSALAQIRDYRIEKVKQLKDMGIDPYPSKSFRTHTTDQINNNYDELEGQEVTVSGRLVSWREHGHLIFGHIQDQKGRVQLYIRDEELKPTNVDSQTLGFDNFNLLDVGDIIEATGIVTKTQRGEISVQPKTVRMLTKSIRPLPEKWQGIKDQETLFRKRYLDMIMNPDHKWRFEKAAQITFAIREFLNHRGFLEIKTPIIQPVYGGTTAKPFKTTVNALNSDYYLAVSHELYLKRLITAGFENVYNLVGYFRNEGIDRSHNPEFNMIETMTAFKNYEYNMELTEELYKYIGEKVFGKTVFKIQGQDVDFGKPWERIMMIDAVKKYANYDFNQVKSIEEAHKILDEIGYRDDKPASIGESMLKVFEEKVEEQLIQPTFIYGHPVEISPLAKTMTNDPRFVERFEGFMGGIEAGDNWTELNDPVELYERFKEQVERGRGGEDEFHPMDIEFIECMEYGMPPTTGLGPGVERLMMMFTETEYIDDVLFFPMQRPAPISELDKEIYGEEYLVGTEGTDSKTTEQDFSQKFVIVVNKELEAWQHANTIGHISAYLGNTLSETFATGDSFATKDGKTHPRNSQFPIVVLGAKPGQMSNLMEKVRESGLHYHGFIREMIETTDDAEITKILSQKSDSEIEYLGIGIFGKNDDVDGLTKKFSLLK